MQTPSPPPLDPAPSLRELAAWRRRLWVLLLPLSLAVPLVWFAVFEGWLLNTDAVRRTTAAVVGVEHRPGPDRWHVDFRWQDAEGNTHDTRQVFDASVAWQAGDRVDFVHSTAGREVAEALPPSMVFSRRMFLGLAGFVLLFVGIAGAVQWRRIAWRRRLLREGVPVAGQQPDLDVRRIALPKTPEPLVQWRLRLTRFDAAMPGWRVHASDWHQGEPPALDAIAVPPILVDPRHPARAWIPWVATR